MKNRDAIMAILLIAMPGLIQASDWKSSPGFACVPASETEDFSRSFNGNFYNNKNGPMTVYCPVVRDGNYNRVSATVKIQDSHPSSNGYCKLYSTNPEGGHIDQDYSSWSGEGNFTVNLGPIQATSWGSYYIRCQLPGKKANGYPSAIRNFSWNEFN